MWDPDPRTIVVVRERASSAEDGGPRLSDDLGARRDGDGVRHEIYAGVEEDDLAACPLQKLLSVFAPL